MSTRNPIGNWMKVITSLFYWAFHYFGGTDIREIQYRCFVFLKFQILIKRVGSQSAIPELLLHLERYFNIRIRDLSLKNRMKIQALSLPYAISHYSFLIQIVRPILSMHTVRLKVRRISRHTYNRSAEDYSHD
jgi:hypothetical protein